MNHLKSSGTQIPREFEVLAKKGSYGNVRQWTNQLFQKLITEIAGRHEVHAKKESYIDVWDDKRVEYLKKQVIILTIHEPK